MTTTAAEALAPPRRPGVAARAWRFARRHALTVYALLVVAYLMLPIAVVILFSFNAPKGRFNYVWQGFTVDNWVHWDSVLGISGAIQTSLEVAALATVVATAIGTLMAMAIVRHQFVGRGGTNLVVFLPMATPEIVLGASLLTLFLNTSSRVPARVLDGLHRPRDVHRQLRRRDREGAADRVRPPPRGGGDGPRRERAHDLPQGHAASHRARDAGAALLGFALSIDDFVITYLNAGSTQTFPIFVWGIARVSVPPQVNVVASAIFLVAIALGLANVWWRSNPAFFRRKRETADAELRL